MIKRFYFLAAIFVFFISIPGVASALEPQTHTYTLGLVTEYHRYKQDVMKVAGFLNGVEGAYTYHGSLMTDVLPKGMLRVEGDIIFGKLNFNGQLFDGNHYDIKDVKDFQGEVRALAGYDFTIFSSTTITPFAGLGYRYYKNDTSKDNAGYRRVSNTIYSPIGVETSTPFSKGWSAGINLEYDLFWSGWQETFLSDLDSLFSDLTNDQSKGYGMRGSIKVRKAVEDKNFVFEPYLRYWNIGSSDTEKVYHTGVYGGTTFQEPKSSTTEIGVKVGVEF